jgi:hypothetical protein
VIFSAPIVGIHQWLVARKVEEWSDL